MDEQEKKTETEVTPEGAVEVKEEDLDQAAGGAVDAFTPRPVDRLVENPTSPTLAPSDPSLKQSPTLSPTDRNWDVKQL